MWIPVWLYQFFCPLSFTVMFLTLSLTRACIFRIVAS